MCGRAARAIDLHELDEREAERLAARLAGILRLERTPEGRWRALTELAGGWPEPMVGMTPVTPWSEAT